MREFKFDVQLFDSMNWTVKGKAPRPDTRRTIQYQCRIKKTINARPLSLDAPPKNCKSIIIQLNTLNSKNRRIESVPLSARKKNQISTQDAAQNTKSTCRDALTSCNIKTFIYIFVDGESLITGRVFSNHFVQ